MDFNFTTDKPIYLQLVEVFKSGIVSGELKPGERLDSVRDLAMKAKVNPNTMQKALAELERMGLVYTERTSGRFISENQDSISSMKDELAQVLTTDYVNKMNGLGYDKSQIVKMIEA